MEMVVPLNTKSFSVVRRALQIGDPGSCASRTLLWKEDATVAKIL